MTGNSLINLGELSKPATVLVEKISDAIGVLYEPRRIRSIAKAEADADRIRAVAEIEVSDLQRRAVQRWLAEEAKKQDNIETVTSKALPDVADTAEPERIESDWITNFFDKARLVSDHEMQALWAKVLAGEANHPGTYSKRTVNYLASLDSEDARLFAALCGFCWIVQGEQTPIVTGIDASIYGDSGITNDVLAHLDDIGLIRYQYPLVISRGVYGRHESVSYFGHAIELELPRPAENRLDVGGVVLSKVGLELAPVCGASPVDGFLEYTLEIWLKDGVVSSSRLSPRVS